MPSIDAAPRLSPPTPAPSRIADRAISFLVFAIVAWGVLAFGAPYPWAYWPLAGAAAATGLVAYAIAANPMPRAMKPVLWGLVLVAAFGILQTIPLPARVRVALSPATEPFFRTVDLQYAADLAARNSGPPADTHLPRRPLSLNPAATRRAVFLLAAFAVLLAGLTRWLPRRDLRSMVPPLVALGLLVGLIGIVQKAVLGDHAWAGMKIYGFWAPRYKLTTPFGPFVNKNHFAGSPEGGRFQLTALAIATMGAALALTKSRSGLACFAAIVAFAANAAARGRRTLRARLSVVAGLVVLGAAPLAWANVDLVNRFTSGADSVQLRRQAWRDAATIIGDFPLTGTGLNTYGTATVVYQTAQTNLHVQEAHNDYLQLAAEGGVLLGIPALVAVAGCIRGVRRRLVDDARDPMRYWIRFGAATGLAAIALQSLVEFSLQMPGNAALFVVVCAIALHRTPRALRGAGALTRNNGPALSSSVRPQ
jgi:O-antigen ligase/polysaccharide polymerase Wzy-like membrane protein